MGGNVHGAPTVFRVSGDMSPRTGAQGSPRLQRESQDGSKVGAGWEQGQGQWYELMVLKTLADSEMQERVCSGSVNTLGHRGKGRGTVCTRTRFSREPGRGGRLTQGDPREARGWTLGH